MRILNPVLALIFFSTGSAFATDRYIATTGSDATDCSNNASPCLTLSYTINQSLDSDTIHVAAGTYSASSVINVNKTLTFLGNQAGVDARTRFGAESILSVAQGLSVSANEVV